MCIRDSILLPDLRNYLLYDDEEEITQRVIKCPEVIVKFNNDITVLALIDTGCLINGISESWYNQNKKGVEPYEILPMTNTLVISAVGNKSNNIILPNAFIHPDGLALIEHK